MKVNIYSYTYVKYNTCAFYESEKCFEQNCEEKMKHQLYAQCLFRVRLPVCEIIK
jgi:hypothetical protein